MLKRASLRLRSSNLFLLRVQCWSLARTPLFSLSALCLLINRQKMSAINLENVQQNSTTTAFVTALVVNSSLLLLEIGVFVILKQKLWRVYTPRTILPPPDKRAPELPGGIWRWIPALIFAPSEEIIHKNGLDAYMFLRFLRLLIITFAVFTLLTFLIIVPANAVHIKSSLEGLERISWTNITSPSNQSRFGIHVFTVYILTAFVIFMIRREMLHFLHMRHQFLISKSHSRLAQARTILITPVPDELGNERDLRTFASFVPGGIDKVWMYRDTGNLNKLFEEREELCQQLEAAEAMILKTATLAWRKRKKDHDRQFKRKVKDVEHPSNSNDLVLPPANQQLLDELVPQKLRPTHRTGLLGLIGRKVDTIEWCKTEISRINAAIKDSREHAVKGKFLGSAFIRCNLQMGAHVLSQCLSYHEPLWMYNRWMEVNPKDIIWSNLDDGALEMKSRYAISWAATIALIILWAFPVGFIGTLSNLSDLCEKAHWLSWVCKAPPVARGLLEGVLPPLLLAILFALLPFILQGLAWYECIPRWSMISISVYRRFYFFLLIHGFLIVTLSSGITNTIEDILKNPTETVQHLSSQLPGAAVFFLTYMVTQGLAGAGVALLQLVPLVLHFVRKWFLGRTPRQAYDVTFTMPSADFGVLLPRLSLLSTIGFAYSVLSPLINLLALISYVMFYLAWKFLFMQVFDQPDDRETGGMYFPMAINNLFVGLYIEQICLTCLFFLKVSDAGAPAVIEAIFMVILIVLTACAQILLHNAFSPLKHYLPMSLATKKMATRYNRKKKSGDISVDDTEEIDLFSRDRIRYMRKRIKATTKCLDEKLDTLKEKVTGEDKGDDSKNTDKMVDPSIKYEGLTAETAVVSGSSRKASIYSNKSKRQSSTKALPLFDAAAPAVEDSDTPDEEDDDDHAFDHPSTYVDQRWIWLPKDILGLSEFLTQELKEAGVDASDIGATMDERGVVEVSRNPPDKEWSGGHDL